MKHRHNLSPEEIRLEKWLPINGYENEYEVSDMGRVRRLPGYRAKKVRVLNGSVHRDYIMVTLSINDIHDRRLIHRIVGEHFIPNPGNKPFINHLDANPSNNRKSNLEWSTQSENIQHAHKLGNMGGIKSGVSKFGEADILSMRLKYAYGYGLYALSKMYARKKHIIKNIITGQSYHNAPHHINELRTEPKYFKPNMKKETAP